MRRLVIWYNKQKNVYYHKLINGSYDFDYKVGNMNQYGHTIVHIVNDFDYYRRKVPLKKQLISKTIDYLSKYR